VGGADAAPWITRYVAQGGDVGSQVTDAMGRRHRRADRIHTNLLTPRWAMPRP
jgi:hypothetical protein